MLIKANTTGLLFVPLIDVAKPVIAGKEGGISLVPGWNEIPAEDWPLAEPHLQDAIASGKVELRCKEVEDVIDVDGETQKVTKTISLGLGEVRIDYARKIVEGCYNFRDLERWKEDSKLTSELRALADVQLKKIDEVGSK
jgi:hypothetical protein